MKTANPAWHLALGPGDVGSTILLPGDPARCARIASRLEGARRVASHREFTTFTGSLEGETVSVVSTGVGAPSTAVAVEELLALGAHTFIRVGTAGALRPDLAEGDLCVVTGGVRDEGTTPQYLPPEFPAVADPDVVIALRDAARALRAPHRVGITQSKDSLYGEVQPERMPVAERLLARKRAFAAGGAICSEMEASAIFILTSIHGGRAGGLMLVVGEERPRKEHVDRLVRVAVEGVRGLLRRDRESGQSRG